MRPLRPDAAAAARATADHARWAPRADGARRVTATGHAAHDHHDTAEDDHGQHRDHDKSFSPPWHGFS